MPATTLPLVLSLKPSKSESKDPPPPPPSRLPPPPIKNRLPPPPTSKPGPSPPPPKYTAIPNGRPHPPTAKSHQSGTIENHWNDLPSSFLSTPAASRAVSPLPETDAEFEVLVTRLFSPETPSALGDDEKKMLLDRVRKARVPEVQQKELAGILEGVLVRGETAVWGRKRVVEFMMRYPGVAAWAIGVRRGVEGVRV